MNTSKRDPVCRQQACRRVCCPLARDADQIQDGGGRALHLGLVHGSGARSALRKKRTFRKFLFRGVELEKLLDLNHEEFAQLIHARARRRIYRGLKAKPKRFVACLLYTSPSPRDS